MRLLKPLLFLLTSLVAVVCVYCLLSFAMAGHIGVPFKYQKHLEITQAELYKGVGDNFSVVGVDKNVIRSKSGKGAITLNLGDRASKDYRRLTLVVSRLNRELPTHARGGGATILICFMLITPT